MIDIQAGDVVVCVEDFECGCLCRLLPPPIKKGGTYRVARAVPDYEGAALHLVGVPNHAMHDGYCASLFRKVKPATEEFTARIKAVRPIKQREDA